MCYGVQWDTALRFMDPEWNDYAKNSTGKGNYNEEENTNEWRGKTTTTGKSEAYKIKNVYDMAGNMYEWTMESYGTGYRIRRGGNYGRTGKGGPSSVRNNERVQSYSVDGLGFRICLYIK